jgi:hypothetical protein
MGEFFGNNFNGWRMFDRPSVVYDGLVAASISFSIVGKCRAIGCRHIRPFRKEKP